jgi:hypothetical protein
MQPSPLVDLERYIDAAPFACASAKARELWETLSKEHPLVMVDQSGFSFRAYDEPVEMSYASVDTLWCAAYCYAVLYQDRIAQQRQGTLIPIVLEDRTARDAIKLYRRSLVRLHEERDEP